MIDSLKPIHLGPSRTFEDLGGRGGDIHIIYMANPPRQLMPWQLEDYAHQMDQYGTLHLLVMEVVSNSLGQDGISNNLQLSTNVK
jgi:hypothetical protein